MTGDASKVRRPAALLAYRRWSEVSRPLLRRRVSGFAPLLLFSAVCSFYALRLPVELLSFSELIASDAANGSHCRLPRLDPYDPSILEYISVSAPINCKAVQPLLVYLNRTTSELVLNETAFTGSYDRAQTRCEYRCFEHNSGVSDDGAKFESTWHPLEQTRTPLKCEFAEVACSSRTALGLSQKVFSYIFAQVLLKEKFAAIAAPPKLTKLNVVIIGIDSMSYSNFVRQLPRTLAFLQQSDLASYVFRGHTKSGDNTWINTIAMLTGKLVEGVGGFDAELDSSTYERYFDDFAPYIWQNFSRANYATFYCEDRPDISNFNYKPKKGFLWPSTDFYSRPFWQEVWYQFLHRKSSAFCYGSTPEHNIHFDLLSDFVLKHSAAKASYFAYLWWSNLSHDVLNKISAADADFLRLLESLRATLNNTVLFVLSDHGHRYDTIRQTLVGRIEARMPFLSITLPKWFVQRFPNVAANLRVNSEERLTSMFDVHATLVDVLESGAVGSLAEIGSSEESIREMYEPGELERSKSYRGISLFRRIPADRQCRDAKIPEEYCPCYREIAISREDSKLLRFASFLTEHVNGLLRDYQPRVCAPLTLESIKDVHVLLPRTKMLRDPQVHDQVISAGISISYRLQIFVAPNSALLEGIVKHLIDVDRLVVEGEVDRNNKYGNTSFCIENTVLKKYCFCTANLAAKD